MTTSTEPRTILAIRALMAGDVTSCRDHLHAHVRQGGRRLAKHEASALLCALTHANNRYGVGATIESLLGV